jgi:hypothetical protein
MTYLYYYILRLTDDRGNIKKEGVIQTVLETGDCGPAQVFAYSGSTDGKAPGNGPVGKSFFTFLGESRRGHRGPRIQKGGRIGQHRLAGREEGKRRRGGRVRGKFFKVDRASGWPWGRRGRATGRSPLC